MCITWSFSGCFCAHLCDYYTLHLVLCWFVPKTKRNSLYLTDWWVPFVIADGHTGVQLIIYLQQFIHAINLITTIIAGIWVLGCKKGWIGSGNMRMRQILCNVNCMNHSGGYQILSGHLGSWINIRTRWNC